MGCETSPDMFWVGLHRRNETLWSWFWGVLPTK